MNWPDIAEPDEADEPDVVAGAELGVVAGGELGAVVAGAGAVLV